jgi:hypothetical protein
MNEVKYELANNIPKRLLMHTNALVSRASHALMEVISTSPKHICRSMRVRE